MNLEFIVSKDACFYYWLQGISGWDEHASCAPAYSHYRDLLGEISDKQRDALGQIAQILSSSERPRKLLAELYTSLPVSEDANFIAKLSDSFHKIFDNTVWAESSPLLESWKEDLENYHNDRLNNRLRQIKNFLGSGFDLDSKIKVYLLQNPSSMGAAGHAIKETDFILLHPNCSSNPAKLANTISTLSHEYIHHIENASPITRNLFKDSYIKTIGKADLPGPRGYVWKMVYVETIIYAFANNFYDGLLRPEIYGIPVRKTQEVAVSFESMVSGGNYDTNNVIAWVALNIQDEVLLYLESNKIIDSELIDKISDLLLQFYLTKSQK